jgi:hypothetical protein
VLFVEVLLLLFVGLLLFPLFEALASLRRPEVDPLAAAPATKVIKRK